jgi:hypothetical protein
MSSARVIYHLARADFLERVRRYSFLIMLGLAAFLAYQVAIGNMTLHLGKYRGEFNSAWVGAMMTLNITFFLGLFGFYLVKGAVARDRETGVGQIMATTSLTSPNYMLGKWLSNFAVLMAMVAVLAVAGIVIQVWQGESAQIDLPAFLAPFTFIAIPCLALVAAMAVLFEAIPFLQGGFGSIAYFVLFMSSLPVFLESLGGRYAVYEPLGFGILDQSMGAAVRATHPDYTTGFTLGPAERVSGTFLWTGIHWTAGLILARFSYIALAVLLTLLASLFFNRFDPSRSRLRRMKHRVPLSDISLTTGADFVPATQPVSSPALHLTPLPASARQFSFRKLLTAELKLLLKGHRWWWYAVACGLFIAALFNRPENVRAFVLPSTWIWPILIWSGMGSREVRHNVQEMVFSSVAPLRRQLPASWLAGFLVAVLTGSGAALKLLSVGDTVGLMAWLSGALFIPSLALALGVWSKSSKVFEIIYVSLFYLGPLNKVEDVDYLGAHGGGNIGFFIPLSVILIFAAFIGRARQVRK